MTNQTVATVVESTATIVNSEVEAVEKESAVIYHFAEKGEGAGNNSLFKQHLNVPVIGENGEATGEFTKLYANTHILFTGTDGVARGSLADRFQYEHRDAFKAYQKYCEAGHIEEGNLLVLEGRPIFGKRYIDENGKTRREILARRKVMFGITKGSNEEESNLGYLAVVLAKIAAWVERNQNDPEFAPVLCLARPVTPQTNNCPWSKVRDLYEQHLGSLDVPVIVAVAGALAPRTPRVRQVPDLKAELIGNENDALPEGVSAGEDESEGSDPFLPEYHDDDMLDSDPVYEPAELDELFEDDSDINAAAAEALKHAKRIR